MLKEEFKSLKIGDRVRAIKNLGEDSIAQNEIGEVMMVSSPSIVWVRWEKFHENIHDCDGLCENGHGWAVGYKEIELVIPGTPIKRLNRYQILKGLKNG
jgi:hypothetical protein